MWSTPSMPSLPGPLCLGMVAPNRALSMGQIELWFQEFTVFTLQRTRLSPGPRLPLRIRNTHLRNYYDLNG